jgi:putative cell wall-binding protein
MRSSLAILTLPALLLPLLIATPVGAATLSGQVPASQVLAQLVTAGPSTATYDRAYFEHWIDADGDGCNTREEVLIAESTTSAVVGSGCTVASGTWTSWYDGATWTNPSDVDIDHMVPLAEAWKSGADRWTATQRRSYANDLTLPAALEAVTDNVNQSKSDRDPANWLPPMTSVRCRYATNWVLVKYRWNLSVDSTERSTLNSILSGACGNSLVTAPDKAGAPAPTKVLRLAGADRYATAVAISKQYSAGVDVVYIATGANYPDALSAAPAAAAQGGPLLLTPAKTLPSNVKAEIVRLKPKAIVVVGGSAVVSKAVYTALAGLTPHIRRDAGIDRYDTSRVITTRAFPAGAKKAYFATGANFPDALSASAAAGSSASPVILVNGLARSIDSKTAALISRLGVTTAKIAGGTGVVSSGIESSLRAQSTITSVQRLAGADRYATSRAINHAAFATAPQAFFAVGTGFADALAGAALAGRNSAPLYVVPRSCVPSVVISDLTNFGTVQRVLLGGTAVLTSGVERLTPCVTSTPTPAPTPITNPGDIKNCSSFSTWQDAQAWFNKYLKAYGDVADLDRDNDGIACESLPGAP